MIERISFVGPVDDLATSVRRWSALFGAEPTFVDGDRWAQFDLGAVRVSLAGTDRTGEVAQLMLKVADLEAAREAAVAQGLEVGELDRGPHEERCQVREPGGLAAVLYAPLENEA